jgi:hypothetical protein
MLHGRIPSFPYATLPRACNVLNTLTTNAIINACLGKKNESLSFFCSHVASYSKSYKYLRQMSVLAGGLSFFMKEYLMLLSLFQFRPLRVKSTLL